MRVKRLNGKGCTAAAVAAKSLQSCPTLCDPRDIHELPDVQAGFRKGRGNRDQIANVRWIMEKAYNWEGLGAA